MRSFFLAAALAFAAPAQAAEYLIDFDHPEQNPPYVGSLSSVTLPPSMMGGNASGKVGVGGIVFDLYSPVVFKMVSLDLVSFDIRLAVDKDALWATQVIISDYTGGHYNYAINSTGWTHVEANVGMGNFFVSGDIYGTGISAWFVDADYFGEPYAYDQPQFYLDNVIFKDNLPVSPVPEPASWALMIFGFGLVGSILRRARGIRLRPAHF